MNGWLLVSISACLASACMFVFAAWGCREASRNHNTAAARCDASAANYDAAAAAHRDAAAKATARESAAARAMKTPSPSDAHVFELMMAGATTGIISGLAHVGWPVQYAFRLADEFWHRTMGDPAAREVLIDAGRHHLREPGVCPARSTYRTVRVFPNVPNPPKGGA